jgi:hypothetical protein
MRDLSRGSGSVGCVLRTEVRKGLAESSERNAREGVGYPRPCSMEKEEREIPQYILTSPVRTTRLTDLELSSADTFNSDGWTIALSHAEALKNTTVVRGPTSLYDKTRPR